MDFADGPGYLMALSKRTLWIAGLLALALLVLSACSGDTALSDAVRQTNEPAADAGGSLEEAVQVAETFLRAWANNDYPTMYGLISPNSRDAYSEDAFTQVYLRATETMTLQSVSTSTTNALRQEAIASVLYDAHFTTDFFGTIDDYGRTLRLVQTDEGWRVAWSEADLFPELTGGARLEWVRVQPGRANIYDRNGQVLADQNGRAVELRVVKRDVADQAACIEQLSRILKADAEALRATFSRYGNEVLFPVGEVTPETYLAEEQTLLQACAIGDDDRDTRTRATRRYLGVLAPHVVGYVGPIRPDQAAEYAKRGYPPDALIGQDGVEQSFEEYLAGTMGGTLQIVGADGTVRRVLAEVPPQPGQSVYLTIDAELQAAVQEAIADAYEMAGPTWARTSPGAAAVVMDVKTGEILAMVSYPWFDPSVFNPDAMIPNREAQIEALQTDPRTPLLNRATMGALPPGSVFKLVSLATAIDSGIYNANTGWSCSGRWSSDDDWLPVRHDWLPTGHGWVTAPWAITYSCNPYFWQLGKNVQAVDYTLIEQYAHRMGLGVPTGQTVLPEAVGQISNDAIVLRFQGRHWTPADMYNLVIGQGETLVTPLQIARMVAALANGGRVWVPQFVSKVQLIGQTPVLQAEPQVAETLGFDPALHELIQRAMCNVTLDPNGTARYIYRDWYEFHEPDVVVCGKTGTAQSGGAGVRPGAWFAAFAPQEDPEIAIAVVVENSCEGSEVASPIVARIVEDYFGLPHYDYPAFWQTGCFALGD
jgi:penicillin-binding protein 2